MIRELTTEILRDKGTESYNYIPVYLPKANFLFVKEIENNILFINISFRFFL